MWLFYLIYIQAKFNYILLPCVFFFHTMPWCFVPWQELTAMRSGHSTWRPLFRTTERSWPLRTLPRRSSPPLLVIQWVGQVRNEPPYIPPLSSFMFFALHLFYPHFSVSPSHCCFITFLHFLFFIVTSSWPRFLSLLHLFAPISSSLILCTLLLRLRSLMNIKRGAWLFTPSDRLQTLCFLHFLKPHSRYFVHLYLYQTASFRAITFLWI